MRGKSGFEIDASIDSIQCLAPPDNLQHYEGVAFSSSGNILAVAAAGADAVLLFRRTADGRFEDAPYWNIDGPRANLNFPHDVSFVLSGGNELLAAVQRRGVISIWERNQGEDTYGPDPVLEISGQQTELNFSDSVAFVPPNNDYVAATNYTTNSITFYHRTSLSPIGFRFEPEFVLKCPDIVGPDGIAFSQCGSWLAVANHGNHSVSIFARCDGSPARSALTYDPKPVTIISDRTLCHPHSVAFSPKTNHLVVTNSGANYFSVYAPERNSQEQQWSQSAVATIPFSPDSLFQAVNASNKMEGGPKGVAIHKTILAVCGPELGIKIYSCHEYASTFAKYCTDFDRFARATARNIGSLIQSLRMSSGG